MLHSHCSTDEEGGRSTCETHNAKFLHFDERENVKCSHVLAVGSEYPAILCAS